MLEAKEKSQFNYKVIWTTRKYMVFTVGIIAVAVAIAGLGIYPQISESFALRSEYVEEKPKLDKLQAKLAELQNILFTEEFVHAPLVNEALPSNKPLLEFLTSLNSIAVANNIAVKNFEINPGVIATDASQVTQTSKSKGPVDNLELDLEIEGKFDELQAFLLDIEQISPFTTITTLSLGKGTSAADRGTDKLITAALTTKTYFFVQTIKATVEAPLPKLGANDRNVLNALAEFKASDLPIQTEIIGGGVEDPFGVGKIEILEQFRN